MVHRALEEAVTDGSIEALRKAVQDGQAAGLERSAAYRNALEMLEELERLERLIPFMAGLELVDKFFLDKSLKARKGSEPPTHPP